MNQVLFEELFAEMAEKFNIAKLCRDNNKEYDLQSMMIAMSGKVCNQEPINEDKLDELAINECAEFLKKDIIYYEAGDECVECVVLSDAEECYKAGYRKAMEE